MHYLAQNLFFRENMFQKYFGKYLSGKFQTVKINPLGQACISLCFCKFKWDIIYGKNLKYLPLKRGIKIKMDL